MASQKTPERSRALVYDIRVAMLDSFSKLDKCQLGSCILALVANFFLVIGTLTPAWQVAEDTDVNRYVQSGLWLYCPGAAQCWYIFSDDLINYYEKVDVCRFLLIGDCRKKLLRTPYFFGWHYAVLILNLIAIGLTSAAAAVAVLPYFRKRKNRVTAVVFDILIFAAVLILAISLMVFVTNAEMLESKYLIGVKNTFEKYYGYSFYLTCIALLLLIFSSCGGILVTSFAFSKSETASSLDHGRVSSANAPDCQEQPMLSIDVHRNNQFATPSPQPWEFQQKTRHFYSY